MIRLINYIGYCIYSFLPLYLFFLIYYCYYNKETYALLCVMLIIASSLFLIIIIYSKPTNIYVCSKDEVKKASVFSYNNILFLILFFMFWIIDFPILLLPLISFAVILLLYKLNFIFISYTLLIFKYKVYYIRGKKVYSKKSYEELLIYLKKNKYIQIKEISSNIFLEDENYNLKRNYCH